MGVETLPVNVENYAGNKELISLTCIFLNMYFVNELL